MARITTGSTVQLGNQKSIPVRYRGRFGVVVGRSKTNRGTPQTLVAFEGRRAAPLAVNTSFIRG